MKKIIYILVFAIILTSCNNEGTKRQDGSWLISSIDVNEKITGLMGMYYNVIDANIIAIPQGFLKPKKYLVEVTFEKNSFEFPLIEIFNPKKYTYTIDRIRVDSLDNEKYYSKYKSKFNLCGSISNKKDEKIADNYVVMGVDKFLTETKNPNSTKKLYFDIQLKDNRNIKDMVPELTKLSIEGNIAHNKGLIFTQLMQYAVWEKQQQFGSALGLF